MLIYVFAIGTNTREDDFRSFKLVSKCLGRATVWFLLCASKSAKASHKSTFLRIVKQKETPATPTVCILLLVNTFSSNWAILSVTRLETCDPKHGWKNGHVFSRRQLKPAAGSEGFWLFGSYLAVSVATVTFYQPNQTTRWRLQSSFSDINLNFAFGWFKFKSDHFSAVCMFCY